ncbi:hypothetical protein VAEU17_4290057 [Vibrio aestuarianus]|nr:hypothetical protein VAEU17_4290057 [Vibrio aestuarianus]
MFSGSDLLPDYTSLLKIAEPTYIYYFRPMKNKEDDNPNSGGYRF